MNIILLSVFTASVFSIEGLGQNQAIFKTPFYSSVNIAQIEFFLRPEFNFLNEGSDFRGLFWTNPFSLNMKVPLYKGLVFSLASVERFNQAFDIYSEKEALKMYVNGRGGVEELYMQLNQKISIAEFFFRGSYLYGSSSEIWKFTMGDYSIADTFFYRNKGRIFSAGLELFVFSCFYEGLGKLDMEKPSNDTIYDLPQVLGLGFKNSFHNLKFCLLFEHSFGKGFASTDRFKLAIERGAYGLSYSYHPWYLGGIKEHLLGISVKLSLGNFAMISLNFDSGVRLKGSLGEFVFTPELKLTL
ncbi:MAG: hypothetical protein ABIL20_02930, partial [candidate division WOR-3 bacterium]